MDKRETLLIVDMQIDFCPGGSLGVPEGDLIIPVINDYAALFLHRGASVLASRDWHPPRTSHFREFGGLWPPHCIRDTSGAQFHPALRLPEGVLVFSKGMDPERDDYSAWNALSPEGVALREHLRRTGIEALYLCGLATDYCVRETGLEALREGFAVTVLTDAVRGVDLQPGDSKRSLEDVAAAGGRLTDYASLVRLLSQQTG